MKTLNPYYKLFFLLILLIACDHSDSEIPSCIEEKINMLKNEPVQNPPAKIWEWKTSSKTYYYITSDCCDQYNYLYDKNCNLICAPDGGITGSGDGNCPEFEDPLEKTLIWEDLR